MKIKSLKSFHLVLIMLLFMLSACTRNLQKAEDLVGQQEWLRAVAEYRKAVEEKPNDVEVRSLLKQIELKAAEYYYQEGLLLFDKGDLDSAIAHFQQGLSAMPRHNKLLQAIKHVATRKEAIQLYQLALLQIDKGELESANKTLGSVLKKYPEHTEALKVLTQLKTKIAQKQGHQESALASSSPVTLNFQKTDLRKAFEFISEFFSINVIFDESVKNVPVTLYAKDVTFEYALNLMNRTTRTFFKKVDKNTIIIAPDTREKRGQYEDYFVRIFQLNIIRAKAMSNIIKGVISVKKMIINEAMNSIVIRDTKPVLAIIEKIINANDQKSAEILLEVEILEVNRTKAERLGIDLGSYEFGLTTSSVNLGKSISTQLADNSNLTVPSFTWRFFKQDVNAKTLASPKIRVMNGKQAKIHIGDRVPLRSSSITETTGQVRTTFEYQEIGIRFSVEPFIHKDNSTMVKLGLEVSTLGENLGTANDPAFRIGTRNAETFMLLRDGETAILGGLIRDEERRSNVYIPGLGDIPIIGPLFSSDDDSDGRTDVLLTITPRVIRGWTLPEDKDNEFYSGTEKQYLTKSWLPTTKNQPVSKKKGKKSSILNQRSAMTQKQPKAPQMLNTDNDEKDDKKQDDQFLLKTPDLDENTILNQALGQKTNLNSGPNTAKATNQEKAVSSSNTNQSKPILFSFSKSAYQVAKGKTVTLSLNAKNLKQANNIDLEVMYNPKLIRFVEAQAGELTSDQFKVTANTDKGLLYIHWQVAEALSDTLNGILANIKMQGLNTGRSYLVMKMPKVTTAKNKNLKAKVKTSRINIQ